ncbi:unnamed protein product [Microthlaspi erraticum]|nr:unnamed protein product [Microthlaspi erraticum]
MNLSGTDRLDEQDLENVRMFGLQVGHNEVNHYGFPNKSDHAHKATGSYRNSQLRGPAYNNGGGGLPGPYQHLDNPNYYPLNPSVASMMASQLGNSNYSPMYDDVSAASALGFSGMDSRLHGGGFSGQNLSESRNLGRNGNRMMGGGAGLQSHMADPMYHQYADSLDLLNDPLMDRSFMGNNNGYLNMLELQRAYLGAQKSQYCVPYKSGSPNSHSYYGSPTFGSNMSYPGSPLAHHVMQNPLMAPCSPMRRGEVNMRYPSATRNYPGMGYMDSHGSLDEGFGSSLLEEFKSNKTRGFELSEIASHVVEFSADQYGSRFIQQKLETATTDEKNMVYEEIMPEALALMTDVFGNYVIQKFFEHGLPAQRRELAEKLFNNVLPLSLQMYGCRVIQKAIEVVDLDQKIKMVKELDGHVMRCVRDQNGNHVVQKCIECVPEENIEFIISTFFGQVVTLSTHPYGCRVIQRVLEHCHDPDTQSKVMEEILSTVSMLAQDQYGNYVVQHVLEHGKPDERTVIIKELAGKIVQMSQQKFASNVVEKCLTFGGQEERELLVNEMLGTTDENEPLQAMMKDQFANYVVQKVLETCDDQRRELILTRIKVHLNALKKYTYGKHIVARVEKLVAAGERRMGMQSLNQPQVA